MSNIVDLFMSLIVEDIDRFIEIDDNYFYKDSLTYEGYGIGEGSYKNIIIYERSNRYEKGCGKCKGSGNKHIFFIGD